jgi:hypothetical protein
MAWAAKEVWSIHSCGMENGDRYAGGILVRTKKVKSTKVHKTYRLQKGIRRNDCMAADDRREAQRDG